MVSELRSEDSRLRLEAQALVRGHIESGGTLDLASFFNAPDRVVVALPSYPFERTSLWVEQSAVEPGATPSSLPGVEYPLPGLRGATERRAGQECRVRTLHVDDFWLADHIVAQQHVFPGVGYIEFAVASSGAFALPGPHELRDIVYHSPLVVQGSDDEPELELHGVAAGTGSFRVCTRRSGEETVHCTGTILDGVADPTAFRAHPMNLDIDRMFGELGPRLDREACYAEIRGTGLMLGPSFNAIRTIAFNADRAMAEIVMPEKFVTDHEDFLLHPSIFDGALESVYWLAPAGATSLPVGIDRVGWFSRPLPRCFAYATRSVAGRPGEFSYDVTIYQPDGTRAVAVEGFRFKDLSSGPSHDSDVHSFTFEQVPVALSESPGLEGSLGLVNVTTRMWEALGRTGEVIGVDTPSCSALREGEQQEWMRNEVLPCRDVRAIVIDLTGCGVPGVDEPSAVMAIHDLLASLESHLITRAPTLPQVVLVEPDAPARLTRALRAFALTMTLESPQTKVTVLAADPRDVRFGSRVRRVLLAAPPGFVTWVGDQLMEPRVVPCSSAGTARLEEATGPGVYVITGGMGAIGSLLADRLACRGTNLMLWGRTPLDAERRARIDALAARGGRVEYRVVDLGDAHSVVECLDETERALGPIDGVFHCAGTTHDTMLSVPHVSQSRSVLEPKVAGAWNLRRALEERHARFLVLASSMASVTGNTGQSDYAFANGFMDGLAVDGSNDSRLHTVALDWSVWRDGGIHIEPNVLSMFATVFGITPLTNDQGLASIARSLGGGMQQVIVVAGDRERIKAHLGVAPQSVPPVRRQVSGPGTDLRAWVEQGLRSIIISSIKLSEDDFDPSRTFQEYGYTSLTMVDLANDINARFGTSITPALFFSATTFDKLVEHLVSAEEPSVLRSFKASGSFDAPTAVAAALPGDNRSADDAFAIVGLDVVMPGSRDIHQYWKHLIDCDCMTSQVPSDRWDWQALDADLARAGQDPVSHHGAFMAEVQDFDRSLFGISPREAKFMDPQQRLVLESIHRTIESSGRRVSDMAGSRTGIFIGVATADYSNVLQESAFPVDAYTSTGASHSVLVNRASFHFNWTGPSEPIDTACSSSLVAIHRACEAIRSGTCDAAVAGGVNVIVSPLLHTAFSRAGMLSPSGNCHSFDVAADGYVRGEGVGTLLIKPLSAATSDGDPVLAVIRGTAVNHGGHASSLTAPNPRMQAEVIRDAWRSGDLDSSGIGYIEAHGTGTRLGDPVEIDGLRQGFRSLSPTGELWSDKTCSIGTVKANIGHLEAAAGVAGIAKVVMMLREATIPGHPTLGELNPYLALEDSPFAIQRETSPWPNRGDGESRRAGVSSFGFGGANAHIALEEFRAEGVRPSDGAQFLVFSARSERALVEHMRNHAKALSGSVPPNLADVANTLRNGREQYSHRAVVLVQSGTGVDQVRRALEGESVVPGVDVLMSATFGDEEAVVVRNHPGAVLESSEQVVAFLRGETVEWKIAQDQLTRRAWLPPTPMERVRCWATDGVPSFAMTLGLGVTAADSSAAPQSVTNSLHPMIDECSDTESGAKRFAKTLRDTEFLVAHHVVNGRKVLPGTAYVELAHAVGRQLGMSQACTVSGLVWEQILEMKEPEIELIVDATPRPSQHGAFDLVVSSRSSVGTVRHCCCVVSDGIRSAPMTIDVPGRIQEADRELSREYCYGTLYPRIGFDYGPGFRVTSAIWSQAHGAVTELRLPEGIAGVDDHRFKVHPSLVDGAIRSIAAISEQRHSSTYVPFSVERVEVFAECPAHCFAVVTMGSGTSSRRIQSMLFNVSILDEDGNECVRFNNLMVRGLPRDYTNDDREFFLVPQWVEVPTARPVASSGAEPVLLIGTRNEGFASLSRGLVAGHPGSMAVLVVPQESRERRADDADKGIVEIARDANLLNDVANRCQGLSRVVVDLSGADSAEDLRGQGGLDLLAGVVRAAVSSAGARVQVTVLAPRPDSVTSLTPMAALGLARSMPAVVPNVHWTIAEVDASVSAEGALRRLDRMTNLPSGTRVRIMRDVTLMESMRALDDHELVAEGTGLPDGGVCVLSGGMGKIGQALARKLAADHHMRIAILGRSPLDDRREQLLAELRDMGGEGLYIPCDVSDRHRVATSVETIRSRWGQIDAVIHAAGVMSSRMFLDAPLTDIERVLAAKITGAVNLDAETAQDDLTQFIVFSSVSALVGDMGSGTYGAANALLDGFAEQRENEVRNGRRRGATLCIDWPMWADGGMPIPGGVDSFAENTGMSLLRTDSGIDLFEWITKLGRTRIVPLHGRPTPLRRLFRFTHATQRSAGIAAPVRAAKQQDDLMEVCIDHLKRLIAEASGYAVDEFDEDDDFEEFGIDSLMILSLNDKLAVDFPGLERTIFFEHNSISSLAAHLLEERRAAVEALAARREEPMMTSALPFVEDAALESTSVEVQASVIAQPRRATSVQSFEEAALFAAEEPIAIIGMNGRFPGADSIAEFWTNLCDGKDCVTEIPADRWDLKVFADKHARGESCIYSKWGAFLDDVAGFDPLLFKIPFVDARHIDPQERLFLENVFGTLEEAGYCAFPKDPVNVGVYVGVMYGHYQLLALERTLAGKETITSSTFASIANRTSYVFNFTGPSLAVDTMCSSSLTAIHLACEALRRGDCDMAVAGGVNVTVHPDKYRFLSSQHFLASDGRCHAFGEGGDGYVPGEGVASLLLKPLSKAERDGDHIHALIRGTAINHGGKTNGYTVTNPVAQSEAILSALEKSGVSARDISYIEAHGTGTELGDPIEIRGLTMAFSRSTHDRDFCWIGSVKSNIGHAEGAAGVVSVVKTVEQLRHHAVVPSLHSEVLNPQIAFAETPFRVPHKVEPWQPTGTIHDGVHGSLLAGVSSFGAGGANSHLVLEEYLPAPGREATLRGPGLVPFSARNDAGMRRLLTVWETFLTGSQARSEPGSRMLPALCGALAELLGLPDAGDVDAALALDELGMDSTLWDVLARRIEEFSGHRCNWSEIADLDSVGAIAGHLEEKAMISAAEGLGVREDLPSCGDIAFTMQVGRVHQTGARAAVIADTPAELLAGIRLLLAGETSPTVFASVAGSRRRDDKAVIAEWCAARDLPKIAEAYVSGNSVDWTGVAEGPVRRVSLPLYPCERNALWLDPGPSSPVVVPPDPTPIVANTSTLEAVGFRIHLDPAWMAVSDHVIHGRALLPGAGYLQFANQVASAAAEQPVTVIRNVVWRVPVAVQADMDLDVEVRREGRTIDLTVHAGNKSSPRAFEASLEVGDRQAAERHSDGWSVGGQPSIELEARAIYERFAQVGMAYGQGMQTVLRARVSEAELVADLELPGGWQPSHGMDLHPALLDGAFQAVAITGMRGRQGQQAMIPLGADAITIHAAIPDTCTVHVVPAVAQTFDEERSRHLAKYDIVVIDDSGLIVVEIAGFSGMTVESSGGSVTGPAHSGGEDDDVPTTLELLQRLERGEIPQKLVINALDHGVF
ncbi:SDR family NAD(P)-dependent oxidoreductase [Propionibacterium ruminifibrarum]|uniref:SDR family NAD(P)-dependent oxidoreductase n=1 Tax=Propionibacterium ruminifibrarum TaxID=1962131 RepID=UPI001603AEE4|nr:SDR family NAD(P)-dependent oxidoreductase [Propionibacterium ruminifibrarum]